MRMDQEVSSPAVRRRSLLSLLFLPLLAFIGGIAAMAWLLANWSAAAGFLGLQPAAPPARAAAQVRPQPQPDPFAGGATLAAEQPQRLVIDPE
ncbi:MAG TPA: hypothetical protein VF589_00465, partial [Allosphingosinicella sp.]